MATLGTSGGSTANPFLTKGTCLGCHAQGGASNLVNVGSDLIPQVEHSNGTDLAAGNFGYITGTKNPGGAADSKGHNVIDFNEPDEVLDGPPGGINQSGHNNGFIVGDQFYRSILQKSVEAWTGFNPQNGLDQTEQRP